MKRLASPEIIELECKMQEASERRDKALILFDLSSKLRDRATSKAARDALDHAAADIAAIQKQLRQIEFNFNNR